ncbi:MULTISPECIES: hypothetical protein [unclassified Thioalkalivibrio]|uniref:hypothetical protein n=1 Tax=unclassified Thioalkalivibrio TaxID=2621013 RepID=UPI00037B25C8|nr:MULTISPECIES: hypothetical protein [unclassified Thioalkalivibrio]
MADAKKSYRALLPIRLHGKPHAAGSTVSLSPDEAEDLLRGPYPAVEPIKGAPATPQGKGKNKAKPSGEGSDQEGTGGDAGTDSSTGGDAGAAAGA